MKSKIEKLVKQIDWSYANKKVVGKINEIIDHLNSQSQPEEIDNTKLVMPPSAYEQAEKEGFDMRNKVKSELLPEDTPEECGGSVKSFLKDFDTVVKDIEKKNYPDFIVDTEIESFCWRVVTKAKWSRTDLTQMINELEEKLKLSTD